MRGALALLFVLALPGLASAQLPVRIELHSLYFDQPMGASELMPLVVQAVNLGDETYEGELLLRAEMGIGGGVSATRQISLSPRETREVVLGVPTNVGYAWKAEYRVRGRVYGRGRVTVGSRYRTGLHDVVTLSQNSGLRAALIELDTASGGTHEVTVGSVRRDARTGDALAPTHAMHWRPATEIVAEAEELEQLSPEQQRALVRALRMGGRLVVFPGAREDIQRPFLRSLIGPARWTDRSPDPSFVHSAPRGGHGESDDQSGYRPVFLVPLGEDGRVRSESYGGSARVGFGSVYVASFPVNTALLEQREVQRLVAYLFDQPRVAGEDSPLIFGHDQPEFLNAHSTMFADYLDPNHTYGPALGLVAILLFIYVIVVGPVNFRLIEKKNRPVLALVTTPIIALVFFLAMMAVGFVGKGVTMRSRSLTLTELVAGETEGIEFARFTTFLTRPYEFELSEPADGFLVLTNAGSPAPPLISHDTTPPTHTRLRGGLWDTLYFAQVRPRELSGTIRFRHDAAGNVVEVENATSEELRDAVIHLPLSGLVSLGNMAPGARTPVDASHAIAVSHLPSNVADAVFTANPLRRTAAEALLATATQAGHYVQRAALFASLPDRDETIAGVFGSERELNLLRVVDAPPPPQRMASRRILDRAVDGAQQVDEAAILEVLGGAGIDSEGETP